MKPDSCQSCPLYLAPGPSPSKGDFKAPLVLITNTILSQGEERILWSLTKQANIPLSDCLIIPQVRCHGPINATAVAACKKHCDRDLERSSATTVLLLGQSSFQTYIGSYSTLLTNYNPPNNVNVRMGCVEQKDGRKWIGTLAPYDYMKNVMAKDEVIMHFRKARAISNMDLPFVNIQTSVTDEELPNVIKQLQANKCCADDVETSQTHQETEDEYIAPTDSYECDMVGASTGPWSAVVLTPAQSAVLKPVFDDPTFQRYEHNGPYDQHYTRALTGSTLSSAWFDTMLGAHYDRSDKFKYLKPDCVSRYTLLPYYDRSIEKIDRRFYNGLDVIATHQAGQTLQRRLTMNRILPYLQRVGQPLMLLCDEQYKRGLNIDIDRGCFMKMLIQHKLEHCRELAIEYMLDEGYPEINPFNPHHLKDYLYEIHHLPVQYSKPVHGKAKSISSDFQARERLLTWISNPRFPRRKEAFSKCERLITLVNYYSGEKKKLDFFNTISKDGRIHAYMKAHGQQFYRLSSKPNVQNISTADISEWGGSRNVHAGEDPFGYASGTRYGSLRSLIIADNAEDRILAFDLDQCQIWIYMVLSGSKWLKQIYDSGDYFHGKVYEIVYRQPFFQEGKPRTKKFKRKDVDGQKLRIAKAVPLGFLFGRSGDAVAIEQGWELAEGQRLRHWFLEENNPEILQYHKRLVDEMSSKGYVTQPYDMRCYFPDQKVNDALNSVAQSGEALFMMESLVMIDQALAERGWKERGDRIIFSVHDALYINVRDAANDPQHLIDIHNVVKPILTRLVPQLKGPLFPEGFHFRCSSEVSYMCDWETQDYSDWLVTQEVTTCT